MNNLAVLDEWNLASALPSVREPVAIENRIAVVKGKDGWPVNSPTRGPRCDQYLVPWTGCRVNPGGSVTIFVGKGDVNCHYLKGKTPQDKCAYTTMVDTEGTTVLRFEGAAPDCIPTKVAGKPYNGPWRYLR